MTEDELHRPKYEVTLKDKAKTKKSYYPKEISSIILADLRKSAQSYTEDQCSKCVLTIPAYFNQNQIEDTLAACKDVGLEVQNMVYEPTAAAVYHVFDSLKGNRKIPSVILVFDFGGGTLDLSIIDTS